MTVMTTMTNPLVTYPKFLMKTPLAMPLMPCVLLISFSSKYSSHLYISAVVSFRS